MAAPAGDVEITVEEDAVRPAFILSPTAQQEHFYTALSPP